MKCWPLVCLIFTASLHGDEPRTAGRPATRAQRRRDHGLRAALPHGCALFSGPIRVATMPIASSPVSPR